MVSMELEGQPMESGLPARVVVAGDRFNTIGMGAAYEGRIELDGARKPKHFTLVFTEGPEKGNTNAGIYELEGDTWRICLNTRGGKRPRKFATAAGSGLALETLRRGDARASEAPPAESRKAGATMLPAPPEGDPAPELAGEWSMESCVMNGRPLEAEFLHYGKRTATAGEVTVAMGPQVMLQAAYRVDRSFAPQRMTYMLAHGPHKGKPQLGIYRLEGETLETCFAAPGGKRPGEFSSTAGDGRTHTVWKRCGK